MGNLSELGEVSQGGGGSATLLGAVRAPVTGSGIDARFRARSAWLARTERDFAAARVTAEAGCPDWMALVKQLQSMLDAAADAECLTTVDRERLASQARIIARRAYRRGVEELLERAAEPWAGDASMRRDVLLGKADALMGKLKRLKLEPEVHAVLGARITELRANRTAAEAPQDAADAVRPATGERRLFPRYSEPALTLQLGSHYTRTLNWSLGGLLLAKAPHGAAVAGTRIDLACWIAGGHRYEDQAIVIRQEADGRLALKMRRFGSALVELKQECERRGQLPRI